MKNFLTLTLSVLFCTVLTSFSLIGQCVDDDPTEKGVVPTTVLDANNPNVPGCKRFDPPVEGNLSLDNYGNTINIVISNSACGEVLSWSAPDNIVVDQIIAKGGNGYNVYDYAGTGYTSDGNLHCPVNASGGFADFSHYDICFHYKLSVSKTASTTFTRTYTWDITKACLDGSELTLSDGQVFNYSFSWTATNTGYDDSNFKVSGSITVANNTPYSATITSIADILSDGTAATISGFPALPFTLLPGESAVGTYNAYPADGDAGTNTVTVTTSTAQVEGNTGEADYSFTSPTTEVDKCITVTDNCQAGSVTVCVAQSPYTKSYSCAIGPYPCDTDETYTNSVSFTAGSGATGSAECSVAVHVPECGVGCTLTQGYWKTHSTKGPARPADPTWIQVGGPDATFYLSGKTWYQVFWTAPAGNAYYILAHQFMAARLNILSGASTTADVDACMAFAQTFFSTKTPSTRLTNTQRNQVLNCASTLDNYNNGAIGPGHCDEDGFSGYSLPKVDRPLATNIQPNERNLNLAPNPAKTEVQVNLSSFIGMNVEIKLTDRLGRTVLAQKLDNVEISTYNLQLNTLSIPTGIYQVTVRSNELLLTEPLVIQSDK